MERYPEHRFAASQAQQYKWLEELYPMLFEKVKEKVTSGQFQPIGEGIEFIAAALNLTINLIRRLLGRDGLQHAFRRVYLSPVHVWTEILLFSLPQTLRDL